MPGRIVLIALSAVTVAAPAQTVSPSDRSGSLRQEITRQRYIVLPKPSQDTVRHDAQQAVDQMQAPPRQEELIRSGGAPSGRPDLDRSVVPGIQAQQLDRALRR